MRPRSIRRPAAEGLTALGLVVAPFVLPYVGVASDTLSRILIWGLFGLGFDLLFGFTGLLSFGQSAFFGSGGFVAAYLLAPARSPTSSSALLIGIVGAALIGLARRHARAAPLRHLLRDDHRGVRRDVLLPRELALSTWTGGENGLPGVPTPTFDLRLQTLRVQHRLGDVRLPRGLLLRRLRRRPPHRRSPVGRILTAIRDNPPRAAAVGHDVHRYKLTAFVIAAAYAGLAGGLLGMLQGYMPPDAFTFDTSGQLVMQTVIGGAGTLFGPLVGAAVWLYLRDILQAALRLGATWKLVLGVVFVLLVCFLRRGIVGGLTDLYAALAHAGAKREPTRSRDDPPPADVARRRADAASQRRRRRRRFAGRS